MENVPKKLDFVISRTFQIELSLQREHRLHMFARIHKSHEKDSENSHFGCPWATKWAKRAPKWDTETHLKRRRPSEGVRTSRSHHGGEHLGAFLEANGLRREREDQ